MASDTDGITAATPAEEKPRTGRPRFAQSILVAIAAATLTIVGVTAWRWASRPAVPENTLRASGRIEGRTTVVAANGSAVVAAVQVEEGQVVHAGERLLTLEDPATRARVAAAEQIVRATAAQLAAADRNLALTKRQVTLQVEQAQAACSQARARIDQTRASRGQAARDAGRAEQLGEENVLSKQEVESIRLKATLAEQGATEAEAGLEQAMKQLALAELGTDQVDVLRRQRDALESQMHQARAALTEQQTRVNDFLVTSPLAGTVLTRTVEKGERVNSGTPLFTIVDLNGLYLKIYVPEPRIGNVILGQPARVHVDAYPLREFSARVSKIASEAEFTPKNVETREERVKLVFAVELTLLENPDGVLKPGMPADGTIELHRATKP